MSRSFFDWKRLTDGLKTRQYTGMLLRFTGGDCPLRKMGKKRKDNGETDEQRKERKRLKKEQKKQSNNESKQLHPLVSTPVPLSDGCSDDVFSLKKLELTVSLLPSALSNVLASAEDSLRLFLLRYSDGIEGIMLAYEHVQVLSKINGKLAGVIMNELPHIHYRVAVDALVFNPTPGSILSGTVTDSSFHSHLSLVVHKYFNASISAGSLREAGFEFDDVRLQWYYRQGTSATALKMDDQINFVCQKLYESGGIISIDGSSPVLKGRSD
jgi:RPA43 OB domain in RNA Pol I